MYSFFVRLGSLAEVHAARCLLPLERGRRVILRTPRGVELGEVVRPVHEESKTPESTLRIIRPTSDEDELLIRRLQRHKRSAVEACRAALAEAGSCAMLLDIDQLLDGSTLIMHFLGPVDDISESVTKEIAEQYESIVQTRHFAKLLRDGCGPDCGTESGGGCGDSCAGCSASSACRAN